jgi:uncharacterized protein with HEPN domain
LREKRSRLLPIVLTAITRPISRCGERLRAIELIGEAASHVSESTINGHPEIAWRQIIGQRHVLIHGYGDVDDDLVWNLTRDEIPNLVAILESILRESERTE